MLHTIFIFGSDAFFLKPDAKQSQIPLELVLLNVLPLVEI